jgi:hypothetical protein
MVDIRSLDARDAILLFEVEKTESELYVVRSDESRHLGRDLFGDFCDALLALLEGRSERGASRHDDGFEWQSFRNSFEPVHFFFGRVTRAGFVIKVWDGERGLKAGEIYLNAQEAGAWITRLRQWPRVETLEQTIIGLKAFPRAPLPLSKWGMRERDQRVFAQVAKHIGKIILVRNTNPNALQYIGQKNYKPWPAHLKATTRTFPPNVGLAAADPTDNALETALGELNPPATYEQYKEELAAQGFTVQGEEEGYIIRDASGHAFYPGYYLHGVYDAETGRNIWTGAEGDRLRMELNTRLGEMLIQHGTHDAWALLNDAARAGSLYGAQPPVVAYMPDGSSYFLRTASEMMEFYQLHKIDWYQIYSHY